MYRINKNNNYLVLTSFLVSILIFCGIPLVEAALNVHRNLGDDLLNSVRNHIFVDRKYQHFRHIVNPTCNSLDGLPCPFLDRSDRRNGTFFAEEDDLSYRSFKKSSDKRIKKSDNECLPVMPIAPHSRPFPPISPFLSLPLLNAGVGDDSSSEEFALPASDAIGWLISRQSVFNEVWQMERQLEKERKSQMKSQTMKVFVQEFKDLSEKRSIESKGVKSSNEENRKLGWTHHYSWTSLRYWVQLIDKIVNTFVDFLLSDLEFNEETDEVEPEISPLSTKPQLTKISGELMMGPNSRVINWTRVDIPIQLNQVPTTSQYVPEYWGSTSTVSLRWTGEWEMSSVNEHTKLTSLKTKASGQCGQLKSSEGSILFSKPVVLSVAEIEQMFSRYQLLTSQSDEMIRSDNEDRHLSAGPSFYNSSGVHEVTDDNRSMEAKAVPSTATNNTHREPKKNLTTAVEGHQFNTTEIKNQRQSLFVEGWFWNSEARRQFYNENTNNHNFSSSWFYTSLPFEALKKENFTKAWSIEIDLKTMTPIILKDEIEEMEYVKHQAENLSKNSEILEDKKLKVNILDRMKGTAFLRIDGVTISYAATGIHQVESTNLNEEKVFSLPHPLLSKSFQSQNFLANKFRRVVLPGTKLPLSQRFCLHHLLIHRPAFNKSSPTMDDDKQLESEAYEVGVLFQPFNEKFKQSILTYKDAKVRDARMVNLIDRQNTLKQQEMKKFYEAKKNRRIQSKSLHGSPPAQFDSSSARVLPFPKISTDGMLLNSDLRTPMTQLQMIIHPQIPIEAPVMSLSELLKNNQVIHEKPDSSTEVVFDAVSSRLLHPGRLSKKDLMKKSTQTSKKYDSLTGSEVISIYKEDPDIRLTLLKRKLMMAARQAIETAQKTHELKKNSKVYASEKSQDRKIDQKLGFEENESPGRRQEEGDVIMTEHREQPIPLDDWESFSSSFVKEMETRFRTVLKDHDSEVQAEAQRLGLESLESASDLFKEISVIEVFDQEGGVVTKTFTLDLNDEVQTEELSGDGGSTESTDDTIADSDEDDDLIDDMNKMQQNHESIPSQDSQDLTDDQKKEIRKMFEQNPHSHLVREKDGSFRMISQNRNSKTEAIFSKEEHTHNRVKSAEDIHEEAVKKAQTLHEKVHREASQKKKRETI